MEKGTSFHPQEIKEKVGLEPGSKVQVLEKEGTILIRPVPKDPIAAECGFLQGEFSLVQDLMDKHKRELEREQKDCPR